MRTLILSALLLAGAAALGETPNDPAAAVDAFHAALAAGDAARAEALLAPDAIVLESGFVETRAEYLSHHLAADIAFAREVKQLRSELRVVQEGNLAWLSASTRTTGAYQGRTIDAEGAELIVLARGDTGWRIRAIHWSSHERKPAP